jgi:hypothetical protein
MDEGEAVGLIEDVCAFLGKKPPRDIVFRVSPHAYVNHGRGGRIILPRSDFVRHFQIADSRQARLLVLHETAHYASGAVPGHNADFYALLFRLCREFGVDLAFALADETAYKKRNAPRGYALYLQQETA